MTDHDKKIRLLGRSFTHLDDRRRELDKGHDDVSRRDADARWLKCARDIIALRASTRVSFRIKAMVMLALLEAGLTDEGLRAARSLARDLRA